MIFHEIYGCYYNCVARILAQAVDGHLTYEKMKNIVDEYTFSESFLTILPALESQRWQLLDDKLHTPLKHKPTMPLTEIQLQWLKAISLDPRIRLFDVDTDSLKDVKPLFTPEDYVIFDKYNDGDHYEDELYVQNFRTILKAMHEKRWLKICYRNRKNNIISINCIPVRLEYSQKDDKFRLITAGCRHVDTINLGRILSIELSDKYDNLRFHLPVRKKVYVVLDLIDERNALERVLLHFAHFEKQAEKLSDNRYRITVYYDKDDEIEMVIRILSFGPMVKVIAPQSFVDLIRKRLLMQKGFKL